MTEVTRAPDGPLMGCQTLDLAKSQGLDLFLRLVRTAHVVIESFYPIQDTWRPAEGGPCLGEHNQHVFKDLLGLSEVECVQLLIEEAIC